jgi:hypothetical protein
LKLKSENLRRTDWSYNETAVLRQYESIVLLGRKKAGYEEI